MMKRNTSGVKQNTPGGHREAFMTIYQMSAF